jgi:hypothetical protein
MTDSEPPDPEADRHLCRSTAACNQFLPKVGLCRSEKREQQGERVGEETGGGEGGAELGT